MAGGAIHASGNRPIRNRSARSAASRTSILTRLHSNALTPNGCARCTFAPAACNASTAPHHPYGPLKAVVAVEHAMLIAIWHMINDQAPYRDPGADYYTRLNPDTIKNRAIDQLTAIGYTVTLTPDPSQTRSHSESSRQGLSSAGVGRAWNIALGRAGTAAM